MKGDAQNIRKRLSEAGLSAPMIEAVWPSWWSDDANQSDSARAELRFSIARKLGLSPKSLIEDDVRFIWTDEARFKHLSNEGSEEKSALTSFGVSACRLLVQALRETAPRITAGALDLRTAILQNSQFVDLQSLLATCWSICIPVIHLRVFPLAAKRMHAMTAHVAGRDAILLGRDSLYPAALTFTLAHEIGHIMLGHVNSRSPIVEFGDPLQPSHNDPEEEQADRYALELLLGTPDPDIRTNLSRFTARALAKAVLEQGPDRGIEPGTLALCVAHAKKKWPTAIKAMQYIYARPNPVWLHINNIASNELDFSALSDDAADYLKKVMGLDNGSTHLNG